MKLYEKIIDGKTVIKSRNKIIITKNGLSTYNPTEEMLFADGWVEYVAPEPTEEELLDKARENKLREIKRYDSSPAVNEFTIAEMPVWLDKSTRVGLKLRFESELEEGLTETTLWYNNVQFPLDLDMAIRMLHMIEIYASKCYDMTQQHLANVSNLETIEEVQSYDYRTGYPEKLVF